MSRKLAKILFLVVILIILLFLAVRLSGYRPMKYPADVGSSMYPSISPGDIWLCRMKGGHAADDLKPGMVIMFLKEGRSFFLTKRIIAFENQTVTIKGRETFVDGKKIEESYAFYSGEVPSGINVSHTTSEVKAVRVPPGKLFVMGDNRDNSFDSRDPIFGFVDVRDIVGKPVFILWAKDKSRLGKSMK